MSIRTRITLVGLGIVTIVICCLSGTLFGLISRGIGTDRNELLSARTDQLLAGVAVSTWQMVLARRGREMGLVVTDDVINRALAQLTDNRLRPADFEQLAGGL